MPSPDQGSVDLPVLNFGGRVTQFDAQALPIGASPSNQDTIYSGLDAAGAPLVAGIATRPGMGSGFYAAAFIGNPTINYLKTFVDSRGNFHLLSIDGLGVFRDEVPCPIPPVGVPTTIGSVIAASLTQSDTLLNREWMAISSVATGFGIDIPRQWDSRYFDRVSQVGPGGGITVADYTNTVFLTSATEYSSAIAAISQIGNVVTVIPASQAQLPGPTGAAPVYVSQLAQIGDSIVITGTGISAFNGTFTITGVVATGQTSAPYAYEYVIPTTGLGSASTGTIYTGITTLVGGPFIPGQVPQATITVSGYTAGLAPYNGTWTIRYTPPNQNSETWVYVGTPQLGVGGSTGSIVYPGSISPGAHQAAVCFITRENYITKPSPWVTWTAAGYRQASLSIPKGPPNVIARLVLFTPVIISPATTGPFFYFDGVQTLPLGGTYASMVIPNNTQTGVTLNFDDATLEGSTAGTYLFNLLELGECATTCAYSGREFWTGERNKITNLLNMTFDGGFDTATGDIPLGWAIDPTNGIGGSSSPAPYWGGAYRITGDGNAADQGMITQSVYTDNLGVNILNINTAYSVRVRLNCSPSILNTAAFFIDVYSPTAGTLGTFTETAIYISAAGQYTEWIGSLMNPALTIPADTVIRVYATGLGNAQWIDSDCIEVFPTLQPYNNTLVRGSYALDPESFDQTTGYMIVGVENGYPTKAMFTLLDNKLYIVKETGLYVTQDDGQNEPASWSINTVSSTIGTGSVHGVGVGESWAIIVHRTGAYIFWGSEPVKITQEIQPDWDTINWNYDSTIYVQVDTINKRIHIGAPVNGSTVPNVEFVCDYAQLANAEGSVSAQDIAAHPQAYYSVYNPTKVVAPGKARKWTLWNISMNCATISQRSDGSYHLLRGNATGNGKVFDQVYGQTNDNGVAIDSFYQTAYFPQIEDEQALQLGSHRKLFKYLTGYVDGSGVMTWTYLGAQNQRAIQQSSINLSNPAMYGDFEKNTNFIAERASLLFGSSTLDGWWHLSKLCPTLQREIITPVRGVG